MIDKNEFIADIRHIAWCCYQMGAMQIYNKEINEDQFNSLVNGVQFRLDNPDGTPEENHKNWMKAKKAQGWTWGPVKNFETKQHPDLIPYDLLPQVERMKDTMDLYAHDAAVDLWEEVGGNQ